MASTSLPFAPSNNVFVDKRKAILNEGKKKNHEKLAAVRETRRKLSPEERKAASKVSLEVLADEWLNQQKASLEMRYYLVENLLPTLVVGLEKLLTEVTSRNLVETTEQQPDFNPINFIAQYLMRNNPRYSNFVEAHPYCKSMKQVAKELKRLAYSVEENKLAELKANSMERCAIRKIEEERRIKMLNERKEFLRDTIFNKWLFDGEQNLEVLAVRQALHSWAKGLVEGEMKEDLQDSLEELAAETRFVRVWGAAEFAEHVVKCTGNRPLEQFTELAEYLEIWGMERCKNKHREQRKELLTSVFESCDPNETNAVDRLQILYLLDCYYDSLSSEARDAVQNPRQWPIMDVVEVEDLEDEDLLKSTATLMSQDLVDFYEGAMAGEEGGGGGGGVLVRRGEGLGPGEMKVEGVMNVAIALEVEDHDREGGEVVVGGEVELEADEEGGIRMAISVEVMGGKKGVVKAVEVLGQGVIQLGGKEGAIEGLKGEAKEEVEAGKETVGEKDGKEKEEGAKEVPEERGEKDEGKDLKKSEGLETVVEEDEAKEGKAGTGVKGEDVERVPKTKPSKESISTSDSSTTESTWKSSSTSEEKAPPTQPATQSPSAAPLQTPEAGDAPPTGTGSPHIPKPGSSLLERRLVTGKSRDESLQRMRDVCGMSERPVLPSGPGATWDHEKLNKSQFVQLMELFASREPEQELVESIANYIKVNYTENDKEKSEEVERAQQQVAKRRKVKALFDTWDSDSSGFLELEELQLVLCKWKDFSTEKALEQAKAILQSLGAHNRLTRTQFHTYIDQLTENMSQDECAKFLSFLTTSVKLTFAEQHRGKKRKALLARLSHVGKTSGLNFLEAAKEAVSVLHQDVELFGDNKSVTVLVSMLQASSQPPPAPPALVVKAASHSIEPRVLDMEIQRSFSRGVGFKAVDTALPVHVLSILKHGRITYFIPEHRTSQFDGSLVVVPIINPQQVVLGTVGMDSLCLTQATPTKTTFYAHEVHFLQGVGLCLGEIHHWINVHCRLLKVAQYALQWLHRRCPLLSGGDVYLVQPTHERGCGSEGEEEEVEGKEGVAEGDCNASYNLCLMLSTSSSKPADENINKTIKLNENQFLEYLFECVGNSEPVSAMLYGQHHLAYPIRDHTGCAVALVDLSMPSNQRPTSLQLREITKVLKLLTTAFYKLSSEGQGQEVRAGEGQEAKGGEGQEPKAAKQATPEKTKELDMMNESVSDLPVLFDQLMLADLKEKMSRFDNKLFAELRSYVDPPEAVLQVIRALLYIIYPKEEFEVWADCKQKITVSLVKALETYDPLAVKFHPKLNLIKELIDLPLGSLHEHCSLPAKYIHNWVQACLPLLEYATLSVLSAPVPLTATTSAPLPPPSSADTTPTSSLPPSASLP